MASASGSHGRSATRTIHRASPLDALELVEAGEEQGCAGLQRDRIQ